MCHAGLSGDIVVRCVGGFDRDSASLLTECLREILETCGGDQTMVVNLAGTTFVDVRAMCSLFEAAGLARDRGSRSRRRVGTG